MTQKALDEATTSAPSRDAADLPDVPLSLIAHLLARGRVDEGTFEENILPWVPEGSLVHQRVAEVEALRRRFCHPLPTSMVYELHCLEEDLRRVLEFAEEVPELLELQRQRGSYSEFLPTWSLAMRLCESCVDIAARDPQRGVHVARAARAIAQDLPENEISRHQCQQLEALTWAHEANAHRIAGHMRRAGKCFVEVNQLTRRRLTSIGLWAEVLRLEGAFLRDSRQLAQARQAFEQSRDLAEAAQRTDYVAAALLYLASLDYEEGAVESAVERTRQAVAQLDPAEHPQWYADACINVAYYLCRAGEGAPALDHLVRHMPTLRQHCSPGDLARISWIEGAALRTLGNYEQAAAKYDESRRAFFELERGYDVAIVTLELAVLHLEQGHTAEVKRLAAEILPVFEMEGIDREARATLELFRQAVAAEQITLLQLRGWLGRMGV